jgi:quinol-cytochrome oxidoreductase complex cytochrome b subunit
MSVSSIGLFWDNLKHLPQTVRSSLLRHSKPDSDRTRSQTVFSNFFLHIHSTRVHPRSLQLTATWGLGVALLSQFIILTATGVLLMVYYNPSTELAYNSVKDIHYVVPTGRFIRNIHRWAAHFMVFTVILHMARVFYTSAYKAPREFNWLLGMVLFILTLALSFTGYLLPWDQLAFWAITIGANIAASPNEVVNALGLPAMFKVGDIQKQVLLGSSEVGQEALTRFYMLHVIVLPILLTTIAFVHIWRIRKDGGLAHPDGTPTTAGKGVGSMESVACAAEEAPNKTYGLMCIVKDKSPHTGLRSDETVPSFPYLLRAELLVFMITMLLCVSAALLFDAPLKEPANPSVPENPAKAPWYFLGLQEMVSYSAFVGGILIPTIAVLGLALIPFLDREKEKCGVWFSGSRGKRVMLKSSLVGAVFAILAVAFPVNFGWLRNWFPSIPQLIIILFNPGSLLTAVYMTYSIYVMKKSNSTRMAAIALFTCFLVGFIILTYVGTYLRGPNWDFYWSPSQWPAH